MRVFLIAGEASGDKLGAALMAGLRSRVPDVQFDGIGGVKMQAEGLTSRFPMSELSVMGLAEILPKYRALRQRMQDTARIVIATAPDVLITIDSPDFCFRVAQRVKMARRIRTVHYVAPTVWAWRPGRARKIARYIDHLLTLLPFEPDYFTPHGMACDFVGHPVVAEPRATHAEADVFRSQHGIGDAPLLLALPGSRDAEIRRLGAVFGASLGPLLARSPGLCVALPVADGMIGTVREVVREWPVAPVLLEPGHDGPGLAAARKRAAFRAADLALAASGTVSLELAAARTPMVIAYRMHWLSFRIIRWLALVDTVTLVNLVSETRVVPEFLGPDCTADRIGPALAEILEQPDSQHAAMESTMRRLGEGGPPPGLRAADAILARMSR